MKRVVSYGAGVDSTAMTILLLNQGEKLDLVIFADTGGEWPETYAFVEKFDAYLRERAQLSITKIQAKEGPMYEYMIARGWVPSRQRPSEIERWKIRPILQFLRTWRDGEKVEMSMGIDYDERDRIADPRRKYITNRYPLIEAGVGRREAENLIKEVGLPIPIKSGCFFCPFQNQARWMRLKEVHPDRFDLAMGLEEANKFFPRRTLFYKGPLRDLNGDGRPRRRSTKRVLLNEELDGQKTFDMVCAAAGMCGA